MRPGGDDPPDEDQDRGDPFATSIRIETATNSSPVSLAAAAPATVAKMAHSSTDR